jgi:resuscitation-promoting factor RpfB
MATPCMARLLAVAVAVIAAGACSAPVATETAAPLGPPPATTTTTIPTMTPTTATPTTEREVTTTVTEAVAIPFGSKTVDDGALEKGRTVVRTLGREGRKTVTWLVRTKAGVEVGRTVSSEQVTQPPVDQVTAVGTMTPTAKATSTPKPATTPTKPPSGSGCDPNYAGACVPIASDVDCAGGSGNGPAYVAGPVRVVGQDIYGLDADHDGIGCE